MPTINSIDFVSACQDIALKHFGSFVQAELWFKIPNPVLDHKSPKEWIDAGRAKELWAHMHAAIDDAKVQREISSRDISLNTTPSVYAACRLLSEGKGVTVGILIELRDVLNKLIEENTEKIEMPVIKRPADVDWGF